MIWKKQPVGSKLETLNSNVSNKTLNTLDSSWKNNVNLNDVSGTKIIFVGASPVNAPTGWSYFSMMQYEINRSYKFQIIYGLNGTMILRCENNGTWGSWEPLASDSKINDYHTNSSTSTYASWDVKYSIIGRVCTFIFGFTPSTNISSSIGAIGDTGLPNPASTDYVCIYPVTKVQQSYTLADAQNRFGGVKNVGSSNAEVRAVGAYETGVKYSFCGSYVIAS